MNAYDVGIASLDLVSMFYYSFLKINFKRSIFSYDLKKSIYLVKNDKKKKNFICKMNEKHIFIKKTYYFNFYKIKI